MIEEPGGDPRRRRLIVEIDDEEVSEPHRPAQMLLVLEVEAGDHQGIELLGVTRQPRPHLLARAGGAGGETVAGGVAEIAARPLRRPGRRAFEVAGGNRRAHEQPPAPR